MADAEERFRLLYQKAPVPLHSVNERLRLVEVNESWLELLGYERHEVLDQPIASFMTDESARRYFELVPPAFLRGEAIKDLELRFVTKRGEERKVIFSARAQPGEHDGAYETIAVLHDPAPRQHAEAELRTRAEEYRVLVEGIVGHALYMLDARGRISSWNTSARRIKGYTSEEIIGRHFSHFYTEEDRAGGKPAHGLDTAAKHGRYEAEGWRVRKDGTRFWAGVVIDAIRDESGQLVGFAKITRDLTERVMHQEMLEQARSALMQSQKMEAIGQLTGGVAHDFNNLLTAILGNLELLGRHSEIQNPAIQRLIGNAQRAVERGASLTKRLLAFSRRQMLAPSFTDLNRLVAGMSDLLRRTLGESIAVETVLAGGLWSALVDQNQLESALLNLAVNARDAMPSGGKLTIETGNTYLDEEYAAAHAEVTPGQYVVLAVTDSGAGMSDDIRARAFEPFFTTKAGNQGTGLGLSQVYGFVKQSAGHVKIYSEAERGATVKIYLPRYIGQGVHEPALERQAALAPGHGETVLVVEDDDGVRQYSSTALRQLGYHVFEAADGAAALRVLEHQKDIALLFTDVGLPGINGRVLAKQAQRRLPGLRVVFTTGYARNAIVHGGLLDPGVELLPKPFTIDSLARKLRQVLDGT
jgi:PAS domain S-box-containing protein